MCVQDLFTYPDDTIRIAARYYMVNGTDRRDVCKKLAKRFLSHYAAHMDFACNNPADLVTMMEWDKDNTADIRVKFLDPNDYSKKADIICYNIDSFKQLLGEENYQLYAWYPNDKRQLMDIPLDDNGSGGKSSSVDKYFRIPPNYYISNPLGELGNFTAGDYMAYPIYKNKRLGGEYGKIRSSEIQGETIYFLVRADRGEAQRDDVLNEIKRINSLKNIETEDSGEPIQELVKLLDRDSIPDADEGVGGDVNEQLFKDVLHGRVHSVKEWIDAGVDVNVKDENGYTPLIYATAEKMIRGASYFGGGGLRDDIVKALIDAGANVNVRYEYEETPLILAAQADQNEVNIVRELLSAGADVNAQDKFGVTALIYATIGKHVDIVRKLLVAGADVNMRDNKGRTALMYATKNVDIVRALLDAGADVNAKNDYGYTAMDMTDDQEIIDLLRAKVEEE